MPQRTPLAVRNLLHQPSRTVVSIGGVMLAIVLMFMQLGFLGAVGSTATVIYEQMPMDLVVRSPEYLHLFEPASINEDVATNLRGLPEVAEVRLIDTGLMGWLNPQTFETRSIAVMGIDPEAPGIITSELEEKISRLVSPEFILVDRKSRPEFGAVEKQFGPADMGAVTEINNRRVRIVGSFQLGTGLAASGAIVVNREAFQRMAPWNHAGKASLLLIRLRSEVDDIAGQQAVTARLAELDESHWEVLTASDAMRRERMRWYLETPIGMIFWLGVGLAVVVGGVICYMVLASDVLANLPEYATLKAIGYSNRFLASVLLQQSLLLAAAALLPAFIVSWILYELTGRFAGIPIEMTGLRILLVSALSALMCTCAGFVALNKLTKAEPASLF